MARKKRVYESTLVYNVKDNSLYDLFASSDDTAVVKKYSESADSYSVVTKPRIDGSNLSWQLKFDGFESENEANDFVKGMKTAMDKEKANLMMKFNQAANDLKSAMNANYNGYTLRTEKIVDEMLDNDYTLDDVKTVLAVKISDSPWDGRITSKNKEWAKGYISENVNDYKTISTAMRSCHIETGLADLLADEVQKRDGNAQSITQSQSGGKGR
jgi:hypothetical protein